MHSINRFTSAIYKLIIIELSKCTVLTTLYAHDTPLAYLDLPDSISISTLTSFNVSSLTTIKISEVNQDKDGKYWINLTTLFSGISIDRVSSVNVSGSGSYDTNTGKITGLTEGTTITYKYYCNNGMIYTIQPTIKIESLTVPYLETKGVDTDMAISNTLNESDLRDQYGLVNTSEEESDDNYYSLAKAVQNELSISEEYYYFDYDKDQFETVGKDDLLNYTKGTGIYAYKFTVKNNTTGKESTSVSRFFVTEEDGGIFRFSGYIVFFDSESLTISETEIAANLITECINSQFNFKVYKDEGESSIENVESSFFFITDFTKIVGTENTDLTKLTPGTYEFIIQFWVNNSDTAITFVSTKTFNMTVTENSYSYEEDNVSTDNGASGYLIIPKYIELKNDVDNTMTADVEVKFANYTNATGVTYGLCVDRTFKIINTSDEQDTITVTTSSDETSVIESMDENKLYIGGFTTANISSGKKITFTASRKDVVSGARWVGNITFGFYRE